MYIQKIDIPLRAYTTVATYYTSTYFTGQLHEIFFEPSSNTPLCDTTTPLLKIYRNTTKWASNLIFKRCVPSTGVSWRPGYWLNNSTGATVSTAFGSDLKAWNFSDDRLRVICGQSTDAAALRATLNFYIG